MTAAKLILGWGLPWLAGYLWLRLPARRRTADPGTTPFLIGAGFFIGCALLQGVLLAVNSITGSVTALPVLAALAALAALPLLLQRWFPAPPAAAQPPPPPATRTRLPESRAGRLLFYLLLAWTLLHLALAAVEVFNRPVFPWDAWQTWVYRAKAWFFQGEIFRLAHPTDILAGTAETPYNMPGNQYPLLPSLMPFWAATVMGTWSETLVNVPTLLCGIAVAIGFYGLCRRQGLPVLFTVAGVYLLVSVPLVGTHIALAGNGDIWMMGFAGLGFAALFSRFTGAPRLHLLIGFTLLLLAPLVKNEGWVWLTMGVATFILLKWPARALGVTVAGVLLVAVCYVSGLHTLTVPGLGTIGISDDMIHLGPLGSQSILYSHPVEGYVYNLFQSGTWHLLWPLLIAAVLFGGAIGRLQLRGPLLIFTGLFLASQALIFGFTSHGQWAEDYTAINRLPLQLAPVFVFCLLIVGWRALEIAGNRNYRAGVQRAWLPPFLGSLLTLLLLTLYFLFHTPGGTTDKLAFEPADLRAISGTLDSDGTINANEHRSALLTSGPVQINPSTHRWLRVQVSGMSDLPPDFFWRSSSDPSAFQSMALPEAPSSTLDLGAHPGWDGVITEAGLLFLFNDTRTLTLHEFSLSPLTPTNALKDILRGWIKFEPWSQRSNHWLQGGTEHQLVHLAPLVCIGLVLTGLVSLALQRNLRLSNVLAWSLAAWMILDLRWTVNTARAAFLPAESPPVKTVVMDQQRLQRFTEQVKDLFSGKAAKILILPATPAKDFHSLQTKYQLLPYAAYVHRSATRPPPLGAFNYALMLNPKYEDSLTKTDPEFSARRSSIQDLENASLMYRSHVGELWRPPSATDQQ